MFGVGALILFLGYALLYTGTYNLISGGHGPTLWESLGLGTSASIIPWDQITAPITEGTPQ